MTESEEKLIAAMLEDPDVWDGDGHVKDGVLRLLETIMVERLPPQLLADAVACLEPYDKAFRVYKAEAKRLEALYGREFARIAFQKAKEALAT